ncbi:SDR family NAD(P)-dependent oxidoreductase [Ilumatobacter sp.]|uniref:SDR family NAD(P)-dependent oxidoreductase n=1 Tax=Ilumatobacter sp. TaxID=1967498 RepID=UPI003C463A0A
MNADEYPLPNISNDLTGQVALVTGATSGLGRRFARVLAASGANVIAAGRRRERLDEVVAEIESSGGTAVGVEMDMTDTASILAGVDAGAAAVGTITILVNNAGIPDAQRAHKMSIDLIDRVFDTNLRGPYVLSCEIARRLIDEKRPGRQINISSVSATNYDGHGAALYSITKAGIARMSEVLAVEWARNHINVNCIAPGAFRSEMMDGMIERMGDFSSAMPRKRLGDPAQLDSTLLYLCSPASDAVTGTTIKVDDGQSPR